MAETLLDYLAEVDRPEGADGGLRFVDRAEQATWFPWIDIRARALAVCGGLRALGVERGDRVALVFPTGIEFFDAFFGVLLAGAVPVPLYPPVRLG
ncbi:MAG TPA: AMP-dependent synthetase, partial [Acidobacteria bacterium]|nr:AMP-dependent synthetase [Acidobacteriota bacterium]